MIDFTVLTQARALVITRAPFAQADEVDTLLDASAGTDPDGIKTYRPYVVLASLFETRWDQFVSLRGASGAGVEYRDPDTARLAYLKQQARVDETLDLTVPDAWPAHAGGTFAAGW